MTTSDSRRRRRWGFVCWSMNLDAAAIDLILAPGGLREKAGEVGFVGALQDAAGHIGHALVGQHDQPGQIVFENAEIDIGCQTGRGRPRCGH